MSVSDSHPLNSVLVASKSQVAYAGMAAFKGSQEVDVQEFHRLFEEQAKFGGIQVTTGQGIIPVLQVRVEGVRNCTWPPVLRTDNCLSLQLTATDHVACIGVRVDTDKEDKTRLQCKVRNTSGSFTSNQ